MGERRRQDLSPATPLLCRRQLQGVRRCAVPPARARFRGGASQAPRVARLADVVRRFRAVVRRGGEAVPRPRAARRRSARSGRDALSLRAGEARAEGATAVRQAGGDRAQAFPPAARYSARPEGGRVRDADQRVHALLLLRRLPLPPERQGGRAGDVRRSHPARSCQRHAADRRLCHSAGDGHDRRPRRARPRRAQRAGGGVRSGHGGRRVRVAVVRAAATALGERCASKRTRQRFGPTRAQLHAPRDVDRDGGDEGGERHGLPEDACT